MKKKFLSLLLAVILLIGAVLCAPTGAAATVLYGDADGNGEVEIIDVTRIQRHLSGAKPLDEAAQKRSAVSGESELSIIDATLIQRYLAGFFKRFPIEENGTAPEIVTIRFTNSRNWSDVHAYLFNGTTGEALAEWPGVALTDPIGTNGEYDEYALDADLSKYNRIIFSSGRKQTIEAPVTKASWGFTVTDKNTDRFDLDVYTSDQYQKGKIRTVKMDFPVYDEGEQKTVWIYLPDGYDPEDTEKKYSVLYMDDGQVLLGTLPNDDWRCDKTVRSLMNNGGDGIIIVGISSLEGERDRELRPYIGNPALDPEIVAEMLETMTMEEILEEYEKSCQDYEDYCQGNLFADFVVNTVIPYVESHYNVNSVRGFTGSSGGGLMAFYMGMEYPEVFDYVGVMSPSLNVYDETVWNEYLSAKDFSGDVPRMYFFCGNHPKDPIEKQLYPYSVAAEGWLSALGYPTEKMITVTNDYTKHLHKYWGLYLPELLCWGLEL